MAMIDYGAIVWKDGKLISTDMFTPMEDMVGWTDNYKCRLNGSYFAYIGDKDFTVGFYKNAMRVYNARNEHDNEEIYFNDTPFERWSRWRRWYVINSLDDDAEIIVRPRRHHNYYICKMTYRGHEYKVAFGYGVDLGYYKKTHIIDYYGTPWFKAKDLCRDIKYKVEDWRYRNGF